jgi:hypothetical protein
MNWAQIPWDLRERDQWCVAAGPGMFSEKGKEPLGVREDGSFYLASSTQPGTWMSFEQAARAASARGLHVGYMLNEDDPFTCVDFDIKDAANAPDKPETWTTREEMETYYSYLRQFDTYTEWSASGKGFHAWVRGKVGHGARRKGVEVYSQERFMITTGDVVNAKPIEDRELMIKSFAEFIRPKGLADGIVLTEEPEEADDFYILRTALTAENSDKFWKLWKGEWSDLGYPSQSEADLALMSMFTFYSPSNAQCRRLFRESELGKREKATKDDRYLNYTLRTIRNRMHNEAAVEISAVTLAAEAMVRDRQTQLAAEELARLQGFQEGPAEVIPLQVAGQPVPVQQIPNTAAALARAAPVHSTVVAAGVQGIAWPPGVAGRIAQFVYRSSYLPVKEVSVVATIGLLAGLCGKAWHIPMSGLNMYVVLIGRSAIGKEGMNTGLSLLVKEVTKQNPPFANHVCFDDFASGPALTKYTATQSSFVNISGEWGHKLKRMAKSEDGRDQAMTTLRQVMTNLYQKSAPQSIVGGIRYSQADNNAQSVTGVAYSMIGETTPNTFYEALTENMMEDGFLSRFLAIEYTGDRPDENKNMEVIPDSALVEVLSNMATAANRVATFSAPSMPVGRTEEAATIMQSFSDECRDMIRGSQNESFRQMWNRAALKAMRLAALLAVADHHLYPTISVQHIEWAIDVVRRDIGIMKGRLEEGDVGVTAASRSRKLASVLKHYINDELPKKRVAKDQKFKDQRVVTREYLQVYTAGNMAFKKFRGEAPQALELTIKSFIDAGYLAEMDKAKAVAQFQFHGKCYRILSVPDTNIGDEE